MGLQVCLSGHRAQNPKGREASGPGFATCLLGIRSSEAAFSLNSLPCRGLGIDYAPNLFPQAKAEASEKLQKRMFEGRKGSFVRRVLEKDGNVESEEGVTERVN